MSTDYQRAREELGRKLRELRVESPDGRLTGTELAQRLGWPQSKVSKLENGRQTPTDDDLKVWVETVGQPTALPELRARLKGFESQIRSWRRSLAAGHGPVQETWNTLVRESRTLVMWENSTVCGMVQTADYARHVFDRYTDLRGSPRDTEEAVRARMKRQEWLYQPGKQLELLMWEGALWAQVCPPEVLVAQLDRLLGLVGMDTVRLGIIPLSRALRLPPANSFCMLDERLVVLEDWHAELWLDDAETIALYRRVWDTLAESAVYGTDAQQVIARVRRSITV
ncbi:helix-turn-helix transcriptional regulator [Streptomyces olivaceus]|uniref:helix-turn-helix domain-containing protein n=1 Tax=Streptomyces TaxID=1883 RepID=UPI001CCACA7F|nr:MULTISPECIES: helix-turn-helix transcriptional regulator [Streptomyces]MBZ6139412.1 helix-turn-helix transcriptional regulator [Streptomyces olivaceus]MBZ6167175.1 helix-turn-helix transcriptional regulator [Streptomyces olivaceus]MBZ6258083.1 helix-turn-helix transcriptional regulator [Streptomyces olivaceus]MCM8553107.1 helix-turn-helix transcriptional regulator [Streptomyces sp. STCH 565 A]